MLNLVLTPEIPQKAPKRAKRVANGALPKKPRRAKKEYKDSKGTNLKKIRLVESLHDRTQKQPKET